MPKYNTEAEEIRVNFKERKSKDEKGKSSIDALLKEKHRLLRIVAI